MEKDQSGLEGDQSGLEKGPGIDMRNDTSAFPKLNVSSELNSKSSGLDSIASDLGSNLPAIPMIPAIPPIPALTSTLSSRFLSIYADKKSQYSRIVSINPPFILVYRKGEPVKRFAGILSESNLIFFCSNLIDSKSDERIKVGDKEK